jgi:lipopolysaccharide/colanic/teichoic acid biosynthesis glycosyltransferase
MAVPPSIAELDDALVEVQARHPDTGARPRPRSHRGTRSEVRVLVPAPPAWEPPDADGIEVPDGSRHRRLYARALKRGVDLVLASAALVVALPVLAVGAVAVRLTMGGPVLFRQVRLGRDGAPFEVLKFRTMRPDRRRLEAVRVDYRGVERRRTHKTASHPLLTPVGRFLRKWSIDEFPQLFNVLKGEMSLVGPRPELPSVVAGYEPWQYGRLLVRPGLTGLWQISARGDGDPMHARTDLDIEYLRTMSLREDLRIIVATPAAMLGPHKGY